MLVTSQAEQPPLQLLQPKHPPRGPQIALLTVFPCLQSQIARSSLTVSFSLVGLYPRDCSYSNGAIHSLQVVSTLQPELRHCSSHTLRKGQNNYSSYSRAHDYIQIFQPLHLPQPLHFQTVQQKKVKKAAKISTSKNNHLSRKYDLDLLIKYDKTPALCAGWSNAVIFIRFSLEVETTRVHRRPSFSIELCQHKCFGRFGDVTHSILVESLR